jgi:Protein of unknown function (DUF1553)/Protein of unknown function (DUF1549)/Planctomycete cytochrome C
MQRLLLFIVGFVVLSGACTTAVHANGQDDYLERVRPLLSEKCAACHGALKQEAGLRLDAGQLILRGGDSGPVVSPDDVTASTILERVTSSDPDEQMPPPDAGSALDSAQVEILREWISKGAVIPSDEPIPVRPEDHWAWQPPLRPVLEQPAGETDHVVNPIDRMLIRHWHANGITPLPPGDPLLLLRRVHLDLTGLPPSPAQQKEFVEDDSLDCWSRTVDRLLDDPAHGERWARHWMDVWRYSDWDGYRQQVRGSQRHIWHWRDWIVESLNADTGYDQMIREMLAADELYPEDINALRATGFLVRNFHNSNRDIWLDAAVEHTAKAFMALTVNCARCHDHKYDPIPQREYYAFRAIFEPYHVRVDRVPGESNLVKAGVPRVYDKSPDAKTFLYIGGNERLKDEDNPLQPAMPSILPVVLEHKPRELPPIAVFPALRGFVREEQIAKAKQRLADAIAAADVKAAENVAAAAGQSSASAGGDDEQIVEQRVVAAETNLAALELRWQADIAKYGSGEVADLSALNPRAATAEREAIFRQKRLAVSEKQSELAGLSESDADKRAKATEKLRKELQAAKKQLADADAAREKTTGDYSSVGTAYPATTTGRRAALAEALTSPANPLVARVAVNHIWMHHFGEPLVNNVFDFGLRSGPPPLQDVLDFLAVELVENDWSMKHLHRLIVTSNVWQLSSSGDPNVTAANIAVDRENRLQWRANIRRLESEIIRDSVLQVSGALERKMGGPDLPHGEGETSFRRSVYFQHAYEKQMTMMVTFDAAGPQECYRRSSSIVPQQALALSNSPLVLQQSRTLAESINAAETEMSDGRFIDLAFEVILCRPCSASENAACQRFLQDQAELLKQPERLSRFNPDAPAQQGSPPQRARRNLVHVLFNHNDFVTVR